MPITFNIDGDTEEGLWNDDTELSRAIRTLNDHLTIALEQSFMEFVAELAEDIDSRQG